MYDRYKSSRTGEFRRVVIREVNPAKRYVLARDAYDSDYQISFDFHPEVVVVPSPNEIWLIKSYQTEWRLDRKLERESIADLEPGDKLITTAGNLYLKGQGVFVNGVELSAGSGSATGPSIELTMILGG